VILRRDERSYSGKSDIGPDFTCAFMQARILSEGLKGRRRWTG
jgi:hypothetical protein